MNGKYGLKARGTIMTKKTPTDYLKEPYARILIPEENGAYSAEVLEFPGCFAQGNTPTEAIAKLEEAAKSWLTVALARGHEIPDPSSSHGYSGNFALRMPRSLHRSAAMRAERDGISLNQCIVTAIAAWVGADNLFHSTMERLMEITQMTVAQQNFNFIQFVTTEQPVQAEISARYQRLIVHQEA